MLQLAIGRKLPSGNFLKWLSYYVRRIREVQEDMKVLKIAQNLLRSDHRRKKFAKEITDREADKHRLENDCKVEVLKGVMLNKIKENERLKKTIEKLRAPAGFSSKSLRYRLRSASKFVWKVPRKRMVETRSARKWSIGNPLPPSNKAKGSVGRKAGTFRR